MTCSTGARTRSQVNAEVQEGKKLVVIGSSFISMELVVAVSKRNLASIDVIGMESAPFEAVLGTQVGKALQKASRSAHPASYALNNQSFTVP